ncbi:MAG: hypothetical protein ABIZ70_09595, partial [Gemmatimonadales bacterium]
AVLAAAAERLSAEDVVRMIKLLTDTEPAIRRSANPRLVLETLLLRWAMMDRMIDLKALLRGETPAVWAPSAAVPVLPIPQERSALPAKAALTPKGPASSAVASSPAPSAPSAPNVAVPQSAEALLAVWPDVIATATRQSRLLAQALDHATARLQGPGKVVLVFGPDSAVFQEGVERQLAVVETILSARMGVAMTVKLEQGASGSAPTPAKGKRLSAEDLRADRLRELRARDPALDAAADSLDLELVDEG